MMRLQYGNYSHEVGSCVVARSKQLVETQTGFPATEVHNWSISGTIHGTSPADVNNSCFQLEVAYSRHFQDLVMYDSNNTPLFGLRNRGSLSGVKVTGLSWPSGGPGNWTTFAEFQISVTADYFSNLISGGSFPPGGGQGNAGTGAAPGSPDSPTGVIVSFNETLSLSGGGPEIIFVSAIRGLPQKQITQLHRPFNASQSGTIVGYFQPPPPPPKLFPFALVDQTMSRQSPQRKGNQMVNYGLSYSYQYRSATPLIGLPNEIG